MEVNDMKIYVLLKQGYEGSETVCVSEDINKIRTSICEDFDAKEDYPELEIWEDGKMTYDSSSLKMKDNTDVSTYSYVLIFKFQDRSGNPMEIKKYIR